MCLLMPPFAFFCKCPCYCATLGAAREEAQSSAEAAQREAEELTAKVCFLYPHLSHRGAMFRGCLSSPRALRPGKNLLHAFASMFPTHLALLVPRICSASNHSTPYKCPRSPVLRVEGEGEGTAKPEAAAHAFLLPTLLTCMVSRRARAVPRSSHRCAPTS